MSHVLVKGTSKIGSDTFAAETYAIFSTLVGGLWLPIDAVVGGGVVTSWTSRYASITLGNWSTGRYLKSIVNGRTCLVPDGNVDVKCLTTAASDTYRRLYVMAGAPASKSDRMLLATLSSYYDAGLITSASTAMTWQYSGVYRDGVSSNAIAGSQFALYETAATYSNGIRIGGYHNTTQFWNGPIAFVLVLNNTGTPTALQNQRFLALCDRFMTKVDI